jgi:hypothetical protein
MNGLDASEEAKPDERSVVKISQTVAEVLDQHVRMEMECIDRMYLNVYVPQLQHVAGAVQFFPIPPEAVLGLVGIDGADQPEVRGVDRAVH